jgi:phospholipase/carboxylesterase
MTRYLLIALLLLSGCRKASRAESAAPAPVPAFGGLEVETVGDGEGPAVVLLHGYGTPPDDLVPLARVLARDPRLAQHRFVMPAGRLSAGRRGRMWWPIAARPIREARVREGGRDVSRERPPELPESRRMVLALVEDLKRRYDLPGDRIALAGFSQGAMLAVQAALHREDPGPVVALSGSLVAQRDLEPRLASARGLRIFVAHGRHDDVLPFSGAEHMRDTLEEAGADVRFLAFEGDHTIPPEVVEAVADFLADALPSRP